MAARSYTKPIKPVEHRVYTETLEKLNRYYKLLLDSRVDFLDSGRATISCLSNHGLCGLVSKSSIRLEPKTAYRLTIKGQSLDTTTFPLVFAEADKMGQKSMSNIPHGQSLLDRDDLLLPSTELGSGVSTIVTNTSSYATYAKIGVKLHEPRVGQEFRIEWIELTKLDAAMVSTHWRTISDSTGYSTAHYDPIAKRWIQASLLLSKEVLGEKGGSKIPE